VPRPEHEKAIAQAIQSRAYQNADQVIERALEVLCSEHDWLMTTKTPSTRKLERAMAEVDRGEGISGQSLRDRIEKRNAAWLADQRRRCPFIVGPEAEEDVFQIRLYLLRKAGRDTDRIENETLDIFRALAATPGKGHRRSHLTRATM
jgi:hypothetical protein